MTFYGTQEERPCPVCTSRDYAKFADERIEEGKLGEFSYASRKMPEFMCLRLVRCKECDLVYAPTPPAFEVLHSEYANASFDSAPEAIAAAKSYAHALKPFFARLPHRHAAVDVGAGSGPLLPLLEAEGFEPVLGIEPSAAAIEAAPETVRRQLREGMFSPEIINDVKPSLICSFMTLEHIDDPGIFVRQAWDLLEPGGMLAVVVHDWKAPLNRLLGMRSPIIDVEHLQLFSRKAMKNLFSSAGFQDIELKSLRNSYPFRYWMRLTPLPQGMKRGLTGALAKTGLADKTVSLNVGNILAVGYKPDKETA